MTDKTTQSLVQFIRANAKAFESISRETALKCPTTSQFAATCRQACLAVADSSDAFMDSLSKLAAAREASGA